MLINIKMVKLKLILDGSNLFLDILSKEKNKIYSQVINNFNILEFNDFLKNDKELIIINNSIEYNLKFDENVFILSRVKYITDNYSKGNIVKFILSEKELNKFKSKFEELS
jgi:hypothetical protein